MRRARPRRPVQIGTEADQVQGDNGLNRRAVGRAGLICRPRGIL